MLNELVFTVDQAKTDTLAEAGLKERSHLQEWVLADPHILGTGTMIITSEFASWAGSDGAGSRQV